MGGQINSSTGFGKFLREFAENRTDLATFVDVGTWDGEGSTRMLADGLAGRPRGSPVPTLWSFETDERMHAAASAKWAKDGPENVETHLVHGRLGGDIAPLGLVRSSPGFKNEMLQWWMGEKRNLMNAPLKRDVLLATVDFVLLDGGEFTTRDDWIFAKTLSPKVVALDDVNTFKCRDIVAELESEPDLWKKIGGGDERNGWVAFERVFPAPIPGLYVVE